MLPALQNSKVFPLASKLHHVQARAEGAVEQVVKLLETIRPHAENLQPPSGCSESLAIGVCVCDANVGGKQAVDLLIQPFVKFLEAGCRLVLTL